MTKRLIYGIFIFGLFATGIIGGISYNTIFAAPPDDAGPTAGVIPVAEVPVGTVLDWYCSADCAIPDGYMIADGSVVTNEASQFFNETVPDLTDKFVRGVTDVNNVGNTWGENSHDHTVTIDDDGSHSHNVNIGGTSSASNHKHSIGEFRADRDPTSTNALLTTIFVDDFTGSNGAHSHNIGSKTSEVDGLHTHTNSVTTENNIPEYIGLVKIIRIL